MSNFSINIEDKWHHIILSKPKIGNQKYYCNKWPKMMFNQSQLQVCFRVVVILYLTSLFNVSECKAELKGVHHNLDGQFSRAKHHNGIRRTDIYFAAFFPMGTKTKAPEGSIGHGVMPAVRLAIKHINQSPNILRGYKLHMYWNDTEVIEIFFLFDVLPPTYCF